MLPQRSLRLISLVAISHFASFSVLAQGSAPGSAVPAPATAEAFKPTWSDPEFAKVAALLTGSWKSSKPVAVGAQSYDILMNVSPVTLPDVPDAMYAEVARSDAPDKPYRQAIWRLYRRQGTVRMQTLEFRRKGGEFGSIVGLWAAPDVFPRTVSMGDLVGTLDIDLKATADGYAGKTPNAYPTAAGGASEMTSEISVNATTFTSADRGTDASGAIVWGPAAGESYGFTRIESPIKVSRMDGGLVVLNYPSELKGEAFGPGTRLTCHYIGQLLDTGYVFDASYERGSPYSYNHGQDILRGWGMAMADARTGMKRRVVIPGALGFGEVGQARAKIGPNATLVFTIDVLNIEKVAQPEGPNVEVKQVDPAAGAQAKPVEAKPVEAKPVEAKPVEAKPVDPKPSDPDAPKKPE